MDRISWDCGWCCCLRWAGWVLKDKQTVAAAVLMTVTKVIWWKLALLQTGGSEPHIFPSCGGLRLLSNTMLLETTWESLPNNSFSRAHECDRHAGRPWYSNMCCSRRHRFEWCHLIITRKPSCCWQTRTTLAKSLHSSRKSSGVVSCIARLPIDSLPVVSCYVLYSNYP